MMKDKSFKCPHCKVEIESWIEQCNVAIEYTVQHDNAFDEIDRDYYGETTFFCPECGEQLDMNFEDIWKGVKANIKKHEKEVKT